MIGALVNHVRKTFHGYAAPVRYSPQWYVGNLVFKAGAPDLKAMSMTGGGQIYGHEFAGTFQPMYKTQTPGIYSMTGPGQIPALPPSLAILYGANQGTGS